MYSKSMHFLQRQPRSRPSRHPARPAVADSARDDPFYYGFRFEHRCGEDGQEALVQVPLPASAFLDPQEGDHLMQGAPHEPIVNALLARLRAFYAASPEVGVFGDMKMCWGTSGLSEPCPDVTVVHGIADRNKRRGVFDPLVEGVLPSLVIEVVSPRFKAGDYEDKPPIYRRAGIEEFLIVDPTHKEDAAPLTLLGYQLSPSTDRYRRWRPDAEGWLRSRTTPLAFRAATIPNPDFPWVDRLEVKDQVTDEKLRSLEEEHRARKAAEAELAALKAHLGLT